MHTLKIWIFLLLCLPGFLPAQAGAPLSRALFIEVGGSGGLGSLNVESQFLRKDRFSLAFRAGFSLAPIDRNNGTGLVFPLMVHAHVGRSAHLLDLGLGQGITFTTRGQFFVLTTAALGYRYQPMNRRWFGRLSYTPLISYLLDFQVQHWAGISFGYTFPAAKP